MTNSNLGRIKKKSRGLKTPRMRVFMLSLFLIVSSGVFAQQVTIKGKIIDPATKEGIPGANVIEKGTTNGTITNLDGEYTIMVPSDAILQFTFVGYVTQEIPVNGNTQIDVDLAVDTKQLEEVVVVGYGTVRRSDLTGSIASVSGEDLKKVPVSNTAEVLKGRMPGVSVMTADGSPDAEVVIRVRGGGSVTQDNSPLYLVDGFIVSSIRDIPPSDIASISVLKDAAATAIYGAQAANGVILITTNSPKAGRTTVSYNGYAKFNTLAKDRKYEVLDPYEFVMMQYEYAKMNSDADLRNFNRYYGKYEDLELYKDKKPTDWQDEVFGNSQLSQSHNLSVSGGTDKTKLSLSLTNNKDNGLMVGNDYTRNVANFKMSHELFKSLKLDASARISKTDVNGAGTSGSAQMRVRDIIKRAPVNGIADELNIDLTTVDEEDDYQSFLLSMISPVELAEQDWRNKNYDNYVLNAGLTWSPFEGVSLRSTITGNKKFQVQKRFYGPLTSESQKEGNSLPLGTITKSQSSSYRVLNTASYKFKDMGIHKLDLLVGQETYASGGESSFIRAENFRESMKPEELFAKIVGENVDDYYNRESIPETRVSFFGRANYSLMDKYLFSGTLRSDASSKFAKENRLGVFPALAFGWKMTEESFLQDFTFLNELKLRASYGATGNDRIDEDAAVFLFKLDSDNGPGMGTNSYNSYYTPSGDILYNPDLVWETTLNSNLGLDFTMFNGVIGGTVDVYYNVTKDLLIQSNISPISGFDSQWKNIGSTSNRGLEVSLNTTILQTSDFSLSANLNVSVNRYKIEDLGGVDRAYYKSDWASTDLKDRNDFYLAVGEAIGLMYGYVSDGMYTVDDFESYDAVADSYVLKGGLVDDRNTLGVSDMRPGYMKLKDISGPDGTPDGVIDSYDRKEIGSALPDAIGGFGFDATYKGFDCSIMFSWSVGADIYNTGNIDYTSLYRSTYGNMLASQSSDNRFTYIDVDGKYTGTAGGVVTDLEQLREMNAGKNTWSGSKSFGSAAAVFSDDAVESGSYLRFQTLTLGYTVPSALTKKAGVSNLRLYVSGNNLWIWTNYSGYDPEVSTTRSSSYAGLTPNVDYSSYPRSRSFTFGVNVTF